MIGTKRRNVSFSSNADDNPFQSKRVGAESLAGQAVASRQVEASSTPPLDRRRAVRQHVMALNSEFASWVQSQIQCHPDELWEDGIRDYLSHASEILEKFSDVVNWMKASNGNASGVSNFENQSSEKKNPSETISKEPQSFPGKIVFGSPSTYTGLATSPNTAASAGVASSLNSGAFGAQSSINGSSATSSAPSWSFGLSPSSQPLSQSSSAGFATSWSFGASSNNNNNTLAPIKTVSFSASPGMGVSSKSETTPLTMSTSSMSSAGAGLFSQNQTPPFGSTPSFSAPWSGGVLSNSQTTFMFGNNNSTASNDNAKENADEDDEPEQPSSPSLKSSEEKGIIVVHETKCKLYLKSTDPDEKEPWKDKGVGQLFIKCQEGASKGTKESKPRILVRNDVGRVMLNALLYSGIKTNLQKNAVVAIFHTSDGCGVESGNAKPVARTFLIKTKNEEERNKLADAIRDHAPAA